MEWKELLVIFQSEADEIFLDFQWCLIAELSSTADFAVINSANSMKSPGNRVFQGKRVVVEH